MNFYKISICFFIFAITALLVIVTSSNTYAQSPYSMYGLGQLQTGEYSRNSGMAGVSIGVRENILLNNTNPAALSALDSSSFIFDVALSGKYSYFSSRTTKETTFEGNVQKIALGFRISPKFATSLGFVPYSNVNYNIHVSELIQGTESYEYLDKYYKGSGGISKLYLGLSYKVLPKLSVGTNASVLFGSIKHEEKGNWNAYEKSTTNQVYFDFGAQYYTNLSGGNMLTIGAVYGYKQKLTFENTFNLQDESGAVIADEVRSSTRRSLPAYYGLGASLASKRLLVAADYRYTQSSAIKSSSRESTSFQDMHKGSIGVDFLPTKGIAHSYFQAIRYQAGFSISNGYIVQRNNPLNMSFTIGALLPLRSGSVVNVAFEYGRLPASIHEDYFQITIGASFISRWFQKLKYD